MNNNIRMRFSVLCKRVRREINALQSENYSLERQLFSYQRSLAMAQARNGVPHHHLGPDDMLPGSSSANGDVYSANQATHRDFYSPRRQESSDTEYA